MKICTKCKIEKSIEDFGKLLKSNDGYNYCCKQCYRNYYTKKTVIYPEGYKKCNTCSSVKLKELFYKNSKSKDGYKNDCKLCLSEKYKKYKSENPEVLKNYIENNKEILKIKRAEYYQKNKEVIKEKVKKWSKENPEKVKINGKKHRHNNKEKIYAKTREWEKDKLSTDPQYRLIKNLRSLVGKSFSKFLKGKLKKSKKSVDMLGCDFTFFIDYIKSQFKNGMTFDNYGEWELDHIKPISKAVSIDEIEQLNHYTNFRPLWKNENRAKSSKIEIIQLKLI